MTWSACPIRELANSSPSSDGRRRLEESSAFLQPKSVFTSAYKKALDTLERGPGSHFITAPVFVRDAEPGRCSAVDTVDVKIDED